jgi:hypothetical protein
VEIENFVTPTSADSEELVSIGVKIGSDPERKPAVRKYNVTMLEILKTALQQAPLTDEQALRLTKKPLKMTLGAVFTFTKETAQLRPAVTPPKTKPKAIPPAPEKLVGDGSGIQKTTHKGASKAKVPEMKRGRFGRGEFKGISLKAFEPGEELTTVKVVTEDVELVATVRKNNATIFEILHMAFVWTEFPAEDVPQLIKKPHDCLDRGWAVRWGGCSH